MGWSNIRGLSLEAKAGGADLRLVLSRVSRCRWVWQSAFLWYVCEILMWSLLMTCWEIRLVSSNMVCWKMDLIYINLSVIFLARNLSIPFSSEIFQLAMWLMTPDGRLFELRILCVVVMDRRCQVNGAWQKLSTWNAAKKPDWQATELAFRFLLLIRNT